MAGPAAPAPATPAQLAVMSVPQRQAYFNSLSPADQAQQRAMYQAYLLQMNREYMRTALRKWVKCPQAAGSALFQAYSAGQQLTWNVPSANNAFLEEVLILCQFTVNCAAGTSATYAINAGAPLTLLDRVQVLYNGTQINLRPYVRKYYKMLRGYQKLSFPSQVLAGQSVSYVQTYEGTTTFPVATGNNTWNFLLHVPLNPIHPQDARGLLPIMGGETTAQVMIQCASGALGPDPVLNAIASTGGTGNAVTVTGNITVFGGFRDGTVLASPYLAGLNILDLPTIQYVMDAPLVNLAAGNVMRNKIGFSDKIYYALLVVIDGQQSNKFCADSNIQTLELDKDAAGQNVFWRFGTGSNIDVQIYFDDIREGLLGIGQDIDEGIIPLICGPIYDTADPSNLDGTQILDTSAAGWTDVHYGVQLGAVGAVSGINPRCELHLIMQNSAGLVPA